MYLAKLYTAFSLLFCSDSTSISNLKWILYQMKASNFLWLVVNFLAWYKTSFKFWREQEIAKLFVKGRILSGVKASYKKVKLCKRNLLVCFSYQLFFYCHSVELCYWQMQADLSSSACGPNCPCKYNYYMASSAGGQVEPNRALWLATRAGKMEPSCLLGTTRCIPHEKFPRKPYNKSFIDQVCSVKMVGYWPRSFFASLWTSTSSRSINTQKKISVTWSITHTYCHMESF